MDGFLDRYVLNICLEGFVERFSALQQKTFFHAKKVFLL